MTVPLLEAAAALVAVAMVQRAVRRGGMMRVALAAFVVGFFLWPAGAPQRVALLLVDGSPPSRQAAAQVVQEGPDHGQKGPNKKDRHQGREAQSVPAVLPQENHHARKKHPAPPPEA